VSGTLAAVFAPYMDKLRSGLGPLALFDAHTHIGANDPDGFKQAPQQLLDRLAECDARALVFPMHEPGGYPEANDAVLAAAGASGGSLVALCRVDPNDGDAAVAEATRAIAAGARGIKLHPRAEGFTLGRPAVDRLVALAAEHGLIVLIHAGRGIPALGEDTVRLSERHRDASLILAHCAISDLAWLWQVMPEHPNLYVDTSWWNPADLIALMSLAPPGQVLFGSDSPYGVPVGAAVNTLRSALQAGLDGEQARAIAGGQLGRLVAGEAPLDLGPAPRAPQTLDPHLDRVVTHLCSAVGRAFGGADATEPVALARLACHVPAGDEVAPICAAVLELLRLYEDGLDHKGRQPFPDSVNFLVSALFVARTPAAGLP
jgi:uncharacterized protein